MNLTPVIKQRFFDHSTGAPLAGGLLYSYAATTTTPQATYTDSSGGTPNANPVVLDANGECNLWLDPTLSYKFILQDSLANVQWTVDNVIGLLTAGSVNTASLQDGCVTTAKLADNAVTSAKLSSDASIDGSRAVQTNHIRNAAVTALKLDSSTTMGPNQLYNLGLSASVATNAMTINVLTNSGGTPSATAPVSIGFHHATATTGQYSQVQITSALSIVVPSGATLGQTSGINQYVWVYLLNNAGVAELAVSGVKLFPDQSVQTSSTIGSGSNTGTTLYSTTGRSSVVVRLIGRIKVNEAAAGTWATSPTELVMAPNPQPTVTEANLTDYPFTFTGLGTVAVNNLYAWRVGDRLYAQGTVTPGTATAVALQINLPSGLTIDTTKASSTASTHVAGYLAYYTASGTSFAGATVGPLPIFYDGSTATCLFVAASATSGALNKSNGSTIFGANPGGFNFSIPIAGWSTFGA